MAKLGSILEFSNAENLESSNLQDGATAHPLQDDFLRHFLSLTLLT